MTQRQHSDPASQLLRARERGALMFATGARFALLAIMAPTVWLLGTSTFDQAATTVALMVAALVLAASGFQVYKDRHLSAPGIANVVVDIALAYDTAAYLVSGPRRSGAAFWSHVEDFDCGAFTTADCLQHVDHAVGLPGGSNCWCHPRSLGAAGAG
jgi:hypothetical protein